MPQIHQARRRRAQDMVRELDADAVLVTAAPNVRYLTGLASSNAALLLPADGDGLLATDSRYALAAERDAPDLELLTERSVEGRLAAACRITAQALADVLPQIRPGLSERSLASVLDYRMTQLGADRPAFDTIVASGPNGAIPHHTPADRPMRRGDLITMDFGAQYGGYHADMTRTVALGEPAGWQREIYELVAAARDLIRDAGHGEHFQHGLGHGIGLEVHEAPMLGYGRTGKLASRVPITVEPGV